MDAKISIKIQGEVIEVEESTEKDEVLHEIYLPFMENRLGGHFAAAKGSGWTPERHLEYYTRSVGGYKDYLAKNVGRMEKPIEEMRKPCQRSKVPDPVRGG